MKSEKLYLKERILTNGPEQLADVELLAVVLNSPEMARTIFHSSANWQRLRRQELQQIPRMRASRIAQLVALLELSARLQADNVELGKKITCSRDVGGIYIPRFRNRKKEHFIVLGLNNKNQILLEHTVAIGGISQVPVEPREVFRPLIEASAARTIAIHNHPSGDAEPSPSDRSVCARLIEVGKLVGIELLDFMIIGGDECLSFRDHGYVFGDK